MGVFHPDLVGIQARVLQRLGSRHVMIVHGLDGLDEISISGDTLVGELKDGRISRIRDRARAVRTAARRPDAIRVADAGEAQANAARGARERARSGAGHRAAERRRDALRGGPCGRHRQQGSTQRGAVLDSGAAAAKLDELVAFSRRICDVR